MLPNLCSSCNQTILELIKIGLDLNVLDSLYTSNSVLKCLFCDQTLHTGHSIKHSEFNESCEHLTEFNQHQSSYNQLQDDNFHQPIINKDSNEFATFESKNYPQLTSRESHRINHYMETVEENFIHNSVGFNHFMDVNEITYDNSNLLYEPIRVDSTESHNYGNANVDTEYVASSGQKLPETTSFFTETEVSMLLNAIMSGEIKCESMDADEQEKLHHQPISPPKENNQKEFKRFILDVDRLTDEARVEVDEKLAQELRPYQREGIKFMYNSLIKCVDRIKEPGSGCILAHEMGSGKSLQVIALIHTLLSNKLTKNRIKHVLITVPIHAIKLWSEELDKWIGSMSLQYKVIINDSKLWIARSDFTQWLIYGGILVVMHSLLTTNCDLVTSITQTSPDILVIDEAHAHYKPDDIFYSTVQKIKTRRKIILDGAPLRNQLIKFYHMIELVQPRLLGNFSAFERAFIDTKKNHEIHDFAFSKKQNFHKIYFLLWKVMQRSIHLNLDLPPKSEFLIFIRPSELIKSVYNSWLHKDWFIPSLKDYSNHFLLLGHPSILLRMVKSEANNDWYKRASDACDSTDCELSGKIVILCKLLEECVNNNEKLVVISAYAEILDFISTIVRHKYNWLVGSDYLTVGVGNVHKKSLDPKFNEQRSVKLLLATTACNSYDWTSASRVIVFDVPLDHFEVNQVISRIYRFGQTRPVYVYRFVTVGTVEQFYLRQHVEMLQLIALALGENCISSAKRLKVKKLCLMKPKDLPEPLNIGNDFLLSKALENQDFVLDFFQINSFLEPLDSSKRKTFLKGNFLNWNRGIQSNSTPPMD